MKMIQLQGFAVYKIKAQLAECLPSMHDALSSNPAALKTDMVYVPIHLAFGRGRQEDQKSRSSSTTQ